MKYLLSASNCLPVDESRNIYIGLSVRPGFKQGKYQAKIPSLSKSENFLVKYLHIAVHFTVVD